jgi:uncharacterized repeat protein (TIGR03803 family)
MKFLKLLMAALGLIIGLAAPRAFGAPQAFLFSPLTTFSATNSGISPYAPPILGPDGSLYGTTTSGSGATKLGSIYRITPDGVFINLHTFTNNESSDAVAPLMFANDGNLYGTASGGGAHSMGTIFRITTNGTFTVLYSFGIVINGLGYALDGSVPYSGLFQGRDGYLYGTTYSGGSSNVGTVFQFSTSGTLITLASFTGNNGAYPEETTLAEGNAGVFYGTTYQGGNNTNGTIFQVTSSGLLSNLHLFNGLDGSGAYNGLSFGSDSNLYGATIFGGAKGDGTVFRITPSGTFSNLYSFDGTHGRSPQSGVAVGTNNVLYGTTYLGGVKNFGTVFQLTTNGQIAILHSFTNSIDGGNPANGVTLGADGTLYGTTLNGGINKGHGIVFSLRPVPSLAIITPTSGQRWSNSVFQVTGTAASNSGITNVYYSLNGSGWTAASSSNSWATWNATINLTPGTNTIAAYAVDAVGNISATNSVNLDYIVSAVLTVEMVGKGTISPNLSNAVLHVGTSYTMKATPAKGYGFFFWNVGAAMSNNPTLTFAMVSNLVITANFKDTEAPTLKITSPRNNARISGSTINVTGTASDNVGVAAVGVQINENIWMTASGTESWNAILPVASGANTIRAYAMDAAGNISRTNTVQITSLLPPDWAPGLVASSTLSVVPDSGDPMSVSFAGDSFSQTDAATNNNSGTGIFTYQQTATNGADLQLTFNAPLNQSNNIPQDIQLNFTNSNAGAFTNTGSSDTGTFSIEVVATILPRSFTGHTMTAISSVDSSTNVVKVTNKTQLNMTKSGITTTYDYVATEASPVGAMFVETDLSGNVTYQQFTFTSKTGGNYQENKFDGNGNFLTGDFGAFTFK